VNSILRYLRALKPALKGKRDEAWDDQVTGFGIRVSDVEDANNARARRGKAGKITFRLRARFSSGAAPDGRESNFFYFDDVLARRLRPEILTSEQALEQGQGVCAGGTR